MPYQIIQQGNKWILKNKETGKVKGTHDSKAKAESQERLLNAIEHGFKPKRP